MPVLLDNATKRRLVYVKRLFFHGHEHIGYDTEFDKMIAIHHFDNAVELLLKCCATKLNVSFRRSHYIKFPDLWDEINQRTPLPKKTEIFQLHDFRSNIQHWGTSPFSTEMVNRFDVYVSDFLREVIEQVFGLDFEDLQMSSLVEDKTLMKILAIAENAFQKREYKKCMRFAAAAFNRALRQQRKDFGLFYSSFKNEELEILEDRVSILSLGIDYMKYKEYKKIAPYATWDVDNENINYCVPLWEQFSAENQEELESKAFSRDNASFCLGFVLDCILRWQL